LLNSGLITNAGVTFQSLENLLLSLVSSISEGLLFIKEFINVIISFLFVTSSDNSSSSLLNLVQPISGLSYDAIMLSQIYTLFLQLPMPASGYYSSV